MRRRGAGLSTPAAPPGASSPASLSGTRRGILPIDPEDWAWLHDLLRRRGETRR